MTNSLPSGYGLHDLTGRQIGRYLLSKQIGSGGVATVYQAYDQVDGRSVALKVLLPTADANTINRFRREAITAGSLRHPNIVRIYQVGTAQQGDVAYIAMELIEGESLGAWLERVGRLRPEETCNLLEPVARALAHAHQAGVVHRDVKPSNILLRPASPGAANSVQLESLDHPVVPLLTDFGVARAMDAPELTNTGRTVGTPAYMAPEQCAGNRVIDGRADIYSLGTVLYRCVVGRLPFSGTTTQILHAHVYAPLTIDDNTLRQLPPIVVDIMRHSMAKKPEERYPDAGAMADELAQAAGRPLRRTPISPTDGSSPDATPFDVTPSDATATLTLSTLPAMTEAQKPSTSVLVPAAAGATALPPTADYQAQTGATTQTQVASAARMRMTVGGNWVSLSVGLLLLLSIIFFVAVLSFSLPTLVARFGGADQDTLESTVTPLAASQNAPEFTADLPPALAPGGPVGNRPPGDGGDGAVTLGAPLGLPAVGAPAFDTPTPTVTPTLPPPPPTFTPTPAPTALPTPTAPVTPAARPDRLFTCPVPIAPLFVPYLAGLNSEQAERFRCPDKLMTQADAQLQRFEYGFMLKLENDPAIYIYYDLSQDWERTASDWREGDPALTGDIDPPSETLFQPMNEFGRLWSEPSRRNALGFATTADPVSFRAVEQAFPGGALLADIDNGYIYLFPHDRLRP